MNGNSFLRSWMVLGGLLQVAVGVLAAFDTRLVGTAANSVFAMSVPHGLVLVLAGVVSIVIATRLRGLARLNATLVYGAVFMVGFAINIASPDLWGWLSVPANDGVHLLHFGIALLSLTAGYLAWSRLFSHPYMRRHHEPHPR